MTEGKIKEHREELANERRYKREFDTRERIDHELIRGYLSDAPGEYGEERRDINLE